MNIIKGLIIKDILQLKKNLTIEKQLGKGLPKELDVL